MRVVFLDIDGVLNSVGCATMYWRKNNRQCVFLDDEMPDPICVSNFAYLLEEFPDLQIIVSSTWRLGKTIEQLNQLMTKWGIPARVIDKTPDLNFTTCRGEEIEHWLKKHPEVEDFIILDDDSDMGIYVDTPNFIKCDSKLGFSVYNNEQAIDYLKREIKVE